MNKTQFAVLTAFLVFGVSLVAFGTGVASAAASPDYSGCSLDEQGTDAYQSCLMEQSTTDDVMNYVHTHPDDLTQKEIDTVYAYPSGEFTESELEKVTKWMTWEKFGNKPAYMSQSNETGNRTVTEDRQTTEKAQVTVSQPRWVSSPVKTVEEGDKTVYVVNGNYQELQLNGVKHSQVTQFGMAGETGALTYDDEAGVYVLDAEQTSGTYQLFWVANVEQNVKEGNKTVTKVKTQRYVAHVRVDSAAISHVDTDQYHQLQDDAGNWTEWKGAVTNVAGENADVKQESQSGLNWIKFTNDPLGYVTGNFFGIMLALVTTPQGITIVVGILSINLPALVWLYRYKNKREALDPEEADIDAKLDQYDVERMNQSLAGTPLSEVYANPETVAKLRDAFDSDSLLDALAGYQSMFLRFRLVRDRLSTMGGAGYRAAVNRLDDGEIDDAYVLEPDDEPDDLEDGYEVEELTGDPGVELARALKDDPVVDEVQLHTLDAESTADLEIERFELEEMLKLMDDEMPRDAATQKKWGKWFLEMTEHVRKHPSTDNEGRLKPMRLVVNDLLKLQWWASDYEGVPLMRWNSEMLLSQLDATDVEDSVNELVNKTQSGDFAGGQDD